MRFVNESDLKKSDVVTVSMLCPRSTFARVSGVLCFSTALRPAISCQEAADRIVQRFYETLDFGVVYRGMYVRNERIRRAEVEIIMGNLIRKGRFNFYLLEESDGFRMLTWTERRRS